jgi:hypothetical protein
MKIKGERKEIVWTVELTDFEMAGLHELLHRYMNSTMNNLHEWSGVYEKFLDEFNTESDRIEEEEPRHG